MSTAFTITAPSGGIRPSSASMRVSNVAQPFVCDGICAVVPPSGPPSSCAAPASGALGGASSSARYARGVTTVNPGVASTINRSSRHARRASSGCLSAIGRPPCVRQLSV